MNENKYLTEMPQSLSEYGICKTLLVRREVIHIKHILTEVFVRKSVNIEKYLTKLGWSLFDYMEHLTNRLRNVHHFTRQYYNDVNRIVKSDRDNFFPTIELYNGLNLLIALDFDGVVTENSFKDLYQLCLDRCNTVIVSANPEIKESWFDNKNYNKPNKIYSCKGKIKKINKLIELSKYYDYIFYIDNEIEYLEYAWLFGIQTYHYDNKKIKYFTLKTK